MNTRDRATRTCCGADLLHTCLCLAGSHNAYLGVVQRMNGAPRITFDDFEANPAWARRTMHRWMRGAGDDARDAGLEIVGAAASEAGGGTSETAGGRVDRGRHGGGDATRQPHPRGVAGGVGAAVGAAQAAWPRPSHRVSGDAHLQQPEGASMHRPHAASAGGAPRSTGRVAREATPPWRPLTGDRRAEGAGRTPGPPGLCVPGDASWTRLHMQGMLAAFSGLEVEWRRGAVRVRAARPGGRCLLATPSGATWIGGTSGWRRPHRRRSVLVRKACSKRRRSRLWSKPVNLRTWGLVSDHIVMVQAFAELRYGAVIHTRENSVKYGMGTI